MPVIEVHNVSKRFYLRYTREFLATGLLDSLFRRNRWEEFWALRNISFSVERGESLGVVGPNGSGKTTLLSILSAVTQPTQGAVRTEGRISALLQLGAGFHPDLTGRENVYINAGVLGFGRRDTDKIYPSVVEFSELGDFLEAPIRRYSSGMLARLGFSIAIHVDPDVIIIDEVLGVGDQQFQKKCHEKILDFIDRGVTILFVSHAAAQVRKLCNKVLYLEQGDLAAFGDVDEVLAAYAARDDKHPTIGTGAQSGPAARPKPAPTVAATASKTPATMAGAAGAARQAAHAARPVPPAPQPKAPAASPTAAPTENDTTSAEQQTPASRPAQKQPLKSVSRKNRPDKDAPSGRFAESAAGVPATTYFYRNGPQLSALFDYIFPLVRERRQIRARFWACSIGAEPYTVAIEHHRRQIKDYTLAIEGLDFDPELIQAAIHAEYNPLELYGRGYGFMPPDPDELLDKYFTKNEDGNYVLVEEIRHNVMFGVSDFLSPACRNLPLADVVFAQNVLIHFDADATRLAISNLAAQTAPQGVLVLGGANLDHLVDSVHFCGLEPLTHHLLEIHDGWRLRRSGERAAWGLEAIDRSRVDWQTRYCSFFRKATQKRRSGRLVARLLGLFRTRQ